MKTMLIPPFPIASIAYTASEERYRSVWGILNDGKVRTMFSTRTGYLGMGPATANPGDLVCILATASVPHVLRKLGKGKYRFIGEAYVHGIMDGEVKPNASDLRSFNMI